MARSLDEWIGKNDDSKVPPRVRLRVFEAHGGRCWISGRKIMPGEPWDLDHKVALINGGQHREANLAPALRDKHREKTAQDVAEKAAIYKKRIKHLGIKKPGALRKHPTLVRGFDGKVRTRSTRPRPDALGEVG